MSKFKTSLIIPLLAITMALYVSKIFAMQSSDWVRGQVVAETDSNNTLFNYHVYRIFIKRASEGYWVQEFYKDSHRKATDPFLLEREDDITRIPYGYYTEDDAGISIIGEYNSWYENGVKMQEGNYAQGKKDGAWFFWYGGGQKNVEGIYELGKKEGVWRQWNIDGSYMETFYNKGRLEAVLSGVKESKENKIKQLSGDKEKKAIWIVWNNEGHLKSQAILVNGKKEGIWISWNEQGKREMIGYYKNNKREGRWQTFWIDDGETKRSEGFYEKGRKIGVWRFWDSQGNKVREEFYKNGRLENSVSF